MQFAKLHALGNDFLVMRVDEAGSLGFSLAGLARAACERNRGIGADGVVFCQPTVGDREADYSALIFNADGSKAEMSGNGIRCLAAYLSHSGMVGTADARIRTVSGIRTCRQKFRSGRCYSYQTSMGPPVLEPPRVPCRLAVAAPILGFPLDLGTEQVPVSIVSMGNPHCTTFWPDIEKAPVASLGPRLESHSAFPRRTNVEFVEVVNRNRLHVRFWERGVGITTASGTGSCAAAVAAMLHRFVDSRVVVETAGGELEVEWDPPGEVLLSGSAVFICSGILPDDFIEPALS